MKKVIFKKMKLIFLISGVLGCLIAAGCTLPTAKTHARRGTQRVQPVTYNRNITSTATSITASTTGVMPDFGYPYGLTSAHIDDAYLQQEYNDWKAHYVTADGAGGYLRVQRDKATDYDTVSEGIGYGMLLAVFFDDKATFDGLYKYSQLHLDNNNGLMHWMEDKNNNNVNEFGLPISSVPSGPYYVKKEDWNNVTKDTIIDASDPKWNGKDFSKDSNYLQVAGSRSFSSATDADMDIAAALCFAAYRWDEGGVAYLGEAAKNIKRVLDNDVTLIGWVRNGALWGGPSCWNPSYFTPAWFRVFKQLITDYKTRLNAVFDGKPDNYIKKCDNAIDTMFTYMKKIDAVNGPGGLYPDWCSTPTSSGVVQKSTGSDRLYYKDETSDGVKMMSFNYYYDAVRVPWRMAVYYSWYGDADAGSIVTKIGNFFKGKVTSLVDGYAIDGSAWKWDDRDGFNDSLGGKNHSVTFIAMNACASLPSGDASYASDFYNETKTNKEDYTADYNYFGNTLRMMSLLYLSGRFINYADLGAFKMTRKPAQMETVGPLTIDLAYTNFGVYGLSHCDFHDRAVLHTSDNSGYAAIGAGQKDSMGDDSMIIGYTAWTGDIVCGLKTLTLRGSVRIRGNVLARGDIEGLEYSNTRTGSLVKNMNKDPGCMDFSVDTTKFKADSSSTPITVSSGAIESRDPGIYGIVDIGDRGTLNLKSGYYYFYSLNTGTDVHLNFDTTNGAVVVCVLDAMQIKSRTVIEGDASRILFISGVEDGGKGPYIAPEVQWKGTLIAPRTGYLNVDIGYDGSVQGAFWGNSTVIHQATKIYFVPFDWSSLPADSGMQPLIQPNTSSSVSVPFTKDGAGDYNWTLSTTPAYINSWNLDELTINGVDFANKWAAGSALPAKINGLYYIHYLGNYSYSHFEIK